MPLTSSMMRALTTGTATEAWQEIISFCLHVHKAPLPPKSNHNLIAERERTVAELDLFLAAAGWDLWREFHTQVERTAVALQEWWNRNAQGRAVLVLDALSLRELPLLMQGAESRGFKVVNAKATGAELPPDTTPFANALGVGSRSTLENGGASSGFKLSGAKTESTNLPWKDCAALVRSEPNWFFWHHFPDIKLHQLVEAGQGIKLLSEEIAVQLTGAEFWEFVDRLAIGRKVVITSDHGYAAANTFADCNEEQSKYLKEIFRSGRAARPVGGGAEASAFFLPPLDLTLDGENEPVRLALGQRKWKSQGGYPLLTHGGLSLHEVLSPFVELGKI